MLIIDAHLDLAMNAMEWNRDLSMSVNDIRASELGMTDKPDRSKGLVSLPALRAGNIGLVVATQIARYVQPESTLKGWHSPEQAWAQTQGQLAWYRAMEAAGEMKQITCLSELEAHLQLWQEENNTKPIGYLLSLEGADSLITIDHLHMAYGYGLRAVGPGHYGPGRYANGTDSSGGLNEMVKALLKEMQSLKMVLDATHLCDDAFWDAMELFDGTIWASHNNCRALVNHNRQFSDEMIQALIQKGAVIGGSLDAWMMVPGWQRGVSTPESMHCNLEKMVDHMDHICQLAGNSLHIGIGTDLDGAYGKEQCPYDIETITDIQTVPVILSKRGYHQTDIESIMHGNWLRLMRKALPNY
jgi:membrane dipeptidase